MRNLRFLPCLLAFSLSLPALANPQAKPKTQNIQFSSPKLAQLEPLFAFAETLEKAFGAADIATMLEKTGLQLLLWPTTQTAWTQKGLAPDKPLVAQTHPSPFFCMGVADTKALAATIHALPGDAKTLKKGSLSYRIVHPSPQHGFVLFWSSSRLCLRPLLPRETGNAPPKNLEATLSKATALSNKAAQQAWPQTSLGDYLCQIEPLSPSQLKLRLKGAHLPWKTKTPPPGKTVLASVSADRGALLKLYGVAASEVFRQMDFIAAFSPKGDALLSQKQTWFSRLPPLLADEFLAQVDYSQGRNGEFFLLMAKINSDSESAFDAWLAEMPQNEAAPLPPAALPTRRGPLSFARKDNWAFASTHPELALTQIESLQKAKPESAPLFSAIAFPQTLGPALLGETFISAALGLSSKQIRMLKFNLPLRNLLNTLSLVKMETLPAANNSTELLVDISLAP